MNNPMQKSGSWFFVFLFLAELISAVACRSPFVPSASDTPAQIEQDIFNLVNDHRRSIGLNELVWSDTIAEQARLHSQSMAAGTMPFGHDDFDGRLAVIAKTIPWRSAGEVVALAAAAAAAVDGWIAGPEHKPILEGNFDWTGIGVAKAGTSFYATETFIKLR
jgi:uncharacterized protein YkwD